MKIEPVEMLKRLIRINTANPPGNEKELLNLLAEILDESHIEYIFQETMPDRGNLLAWLPAQVEKPEAPLLLLSHVDVVDAKEEQWLYPPFEAIETGGYIYGRGTIDSKHLTVMEYFAFLNLKNQGIKRHRPVYFLATSDEESGSTYGLQWFLSHEIMANGKLMKGSDLIKDSDVISEGGGFPIIVGKKEWYLCESGQKTCATVVFKVRSQKADSPFFKNTDGMERAMGLVNEIGAMKLEERTLATVQNFEKTTAGQGLNERMEKLLYAMKHNSITVTMITGTDGNEIEITCDVRLLPGYSKEYLENLLAQLSQKWECDYEITNFASGYENQPEGRVLEILEEATLHNLGKTKEQVGILPFVSTGSSDGHYLTGARVYGYSPVLSWDMTFDSALQMVHGINERIHKESLIFGCEVLKEAVEKLVGKEERI